MDFHAELPAHLDSRFSLLSPPLEDGHPGYYGGDGELIPAGQPIGMGDIPYPGGIFAGYGAMQIGSSQTLDIAVGESVELPLYIGGEPRDDIGYVLTESIDPSVASVDFSRIRK